jgi:hypothetical protein
LLAVKQVSLAGKINVFFTWKWNKLFWKIEIGRKNPAGLQSMAVETAAYVLEATTLNASWTSFRPGSFSQRNRGAGTILTIWSGRCGQTGIPALPRAVPG